MRLDFDRRLMLQFRGSTITSGAGSLPHRELDDAVGLTDPGADTPAVSRQMFAEILTLISRSRAPLATA